MNLRPAMMDRVALVVPEPGLPAVLADVADAGAVELEPAGGDADAAAEPDRMRAAAVCHDGVAAYVGWCPADARPALARRLAPHGGALVPLPVPRGVQPPTLLDRTGRVRRSMAPLVDTYGTVPYADVDPTLAAGLAYIVMFGVMFGDAGHGLVLVLAAVLLRLGRPRRLASLRRIWPFVAGAGLASMAAGVLFGEFFGPTGVVPALWLSPLDQPVRLLAAGVGLGGLLLAAGYALGAVKRWREGGARLALYAPSGVAGVALFAGLGTAAAGLYFHDAWSATAGGLAAAAGLALAGVGLHATAGRGAAGATQTVVQLFDLVIRIGANLVSFARLAAFGLTHAALGALVWSGTAALWRHGGAAWALAVAVFVLGNALTFGLEALVAGVQALRLEYYELFSRVFEETGRPFRPWRGRPATKEGPS